MSARMAIFSLRSVPSFKNQSALLYKAAVHHGWEVDEKDLTQRAEWPQEKWERVIVLCPLWPRYVQDSVRLAAPWLSRTFWLYGPVDGPYTLNVNFDMVIKNTIQEQRLAVPSQACKEWIERSGLHPGMVVPHGGDPADYEFDEVKKREHMNYLRQKYPGKTIFFSNLNPIPRKGFLHLAEALEILERHRPNDWVFILLTGARMATQLAPGLAKISNLVIEDLYNRLPFRQVTLKTLCCDVFVFPSQLEGFGLPVLEAMFAKRPIVMADAPAHNELVDPKSAWLVPVSGVKEERWETPGCVAQLHEYDPSDLAVSMEHAMDHPKESQEKAEHAYERSKKYHYLDVYEPFVKR